MEDRRLNDEFFKHLADKLDKMDEKLTNVMNCTQGLDKNLAVYCERSDEMERQFNSLEEWVQRINEIQAAHANELAEARGASKSNRVLVFVVPTFIQVVLEILKLGKGH